LEVQHSNSGTYSSPYRFNGKELDPETGNYYYGARYYNPQTSLWLSVDPQAHRRNWLTPYNYVQNNPVMRIDPNGEIDWDALGKTIGNFFKKAWSWVKGDGWYLPSETADQVMDGLDWDLEEAIVNVPAPESGNKRSRTNRSGGGSINIYGTGANGVDPWNSYLQYQLFIINMQDPFWSAFFGWGQKGKYNETFPTNWNKAPKKIAKNLTKAYKTVAPYEQRKHLDGTPVAEVPEIENPADSSWQEIQGPFYNEGDTTGHQIIYRSTNSTNGAADSIIWVPYNN